MSFQFCSQKAVVVGLAFAVAIEMTDSGDDQGASEAWHQSFRRV